MKASEYLLAKAIENDDFELSKLASEIKDTDQDIEFITKEASMFTGLGKGLLSAGQKLMTNNTVRNAAIGAGVGTVVGGANAEDGNRLSGALKGGLTGGVLGGGVTAGKNIYKNYQAMGPRVKSPLFKAFRQEGKALTGVASEAQDAFSATRKQALKDLKTK